jgi:hypothetical protein
MMMMLQSMPYVAPETPATVVNTMVSQLNLSLRMTKRAQPLHREKHASAVRDVAAIVALHYRRTGRPYDSKVIIHQADVLVRDNALALPGGSVYVSIVGGGYFTLSSYSSLCCFLAGHVVTLSEPPSIIMVQGIKVASDDYFDALFAAVCKARERTLPEDKWTASFDAREREAADALLGLCV